jgi:rhamnosyltransferase
MSSRKQIGVVVPTYQAVDHLSRCLPPLLASPLRPRILVVDSSSSDGTVAEAQRLGVEALVVPRREFNHGTTREWARQQLATEVVVMLTQDARARDEHALGRLVEPLLAGEAVVSYGRQVPRAGAGMFETLLRSFNYPDESNTRGLEDVPRFGAGVFFCSNAFAAWSQTALDEIGGFRPTLSHEDAIAAALLVKAGHRIAYVADAVVEHSHPYSLLGDFKRYFDAGYARTQYARELAFAGAHVSLGARYARTVMTEVSRSRPWLIPYAAAHIAVKGLGYFAGAWAVGKPPWIGRRLSGQDYFWSSQYRAGL